MTIGDLILKIIADATGFEADLTKTAGKAGDTAGKTLGQRMGAAVKANGAAIIGGAMAAGIGIATRGLLELENVTADFAAATGASADEADRAGKAINAMAGRNIQPLGEVGAALTKVYTDLGLTGDAAEQVTQQFLTFARATKQNTTEAVVAFDNILDAWGLTAADAAGIMDKLVVSQQRYGGSITESQSALAALAPALKAANLGVDDAIGLLNMFEVSGVDSTVAVTGMTKALAKVKSPEELKALIADIIATEDPFLRAQKAAELFGVKAGAKLANALRPGSGGVEAFTVSTEDATGATQRAADVLDSTWGARFKLMIKGAGAALIGFGSNFGPALTGMAALASLGGAKFGGALIGGLKGAWTKAAASSVVTRAVVFAAGKATTVYLAALIAGDAIGAALSKAWAATGARLLAAAGISGAASGTAFAAASAAAIIAAPLAVIYVAIKVADDVRQAKAGFAAQVDDLVKNGTIEGLKSAKAAIEAQIGSQKILGIIPFQFAGEVDSMTAQVARIDAAITALGTTVPPAAEKVGTAAADMARSGKSSFNTLGDAAARARNTIRLNADAIATRIRDLTATLLGEATAMINGYYDPIIAQDELRVLKDTVAADTVARNAAKAGTAARRQADLTLANSQKNLAQTRLNLLAAGTLSAKEQKTWLTELQAKYKSATGDAKKQIGALITKIRELQNVNSSGVVITVGAGHGLNVPIPRARGGPVTAGQPYLVNENTPRSEIWVPDVSGRVLSGATPAAMATPTTVIYNATANVEGLVKATSPLEIARQLGRYARNAQMTPQEPVR